MVNLVYQSTYKFWLQSQLWYRKYVLTVSVFLIYWFSVMVNAEYLNISYSLMIFLQCNPFACCWFSGLFPLSCSRLILQIVLHPMTLSPVLYDDKLQYQSTLFCCMMALGWSRGTENVQSLIICLLFTWSQWIKGTLSETCKKGSRIKLIKR